MFVGTINEPNDKTTFLFLKGDKKIGGFTYFNGKCQNIDEDTMKVFSCFKLGENRKNLGIEDGYQVILDLDTDFRHYFKDGKEDIEKLYFCNGEDAAMFSSCKELDDKKTDNKARIFKTSLGKILFLSYELFIGLIVCIGLLAMTPILDVENINFGDGKVSVAEFSFSDSSLVNFIEDGEIALLSNEVSVEDIRDLIYSSPYLDDKGKKFLYNEQLLRDVLPFYQNSSAALLSKIRHKNIEIVPFTPEEEIERENTSGFYNHDSVLHIRGYESSSQLEDEQVAETTGHEHIHMLEMNYDLKFVSEAVAEIASYEYYLNSCNQNHPFAYDTGVRYTEVLMEIFGSDVIWDRVFRVESDSLENAVKPYLTDDEFVEFFDLLKIKSNKMTKEETSRIYDFLKKLYRMKYDEELENNKLIMAILNREDCQRIYFRKSLLETERSYYSYVSKQTVGLEEAYENGIVKCFVRKEFYTKSDLDEFNKDKNYEVEFDLVSPDSGILYDHDVVLNDGEFEGIVNFSIDGEVVIADINDAIEMKYIYPVYFVSYEVSLEEFKENFERHIGDLYTYYFVKGLNGRFINGRLTNGEFILEYETTERAYVDEIVGQNLTADNQMNFQN